MEIITTGSLLDFLSRGLKQMEEVCFESFGQGFGFIRPAEGDGADVPWRTSGEKREWSTVKHMAGSRKGPPIPDNLPKVELDTAKARI